MLVPKYFKKVYVDNDIYLYYLKMKVQRKKPTKKKVQNLQLNN